MKIHFIAIGGSAMHNLAIALYKMGNIVTGSDDEVFEPSKSRLDKYGLMPSYTGWKPGIITKDIDAVILGMHARKDNPELVKALELGLKIYSYPEYFYEQTKNKTRVVIGGSHGKTTITSMIMHVLKFCGYDFDYLVGSQVEGFETMVGLSSTSKIAVVEGDEYLASPLDPRPKFHIYKPHIAVISGIAWDHINVFPTIDEYVKQFEIFGQCIEDNGSLIYFEKDKYMESVLSKLPSEIEKIPYQAHAAKVKEGKTALQVSRNRMVEIPVFGEHNLQNINAAMQVCSKLGVGDNDFYSAISSFTGAKKRLEVLKQNDHTTIFLDFAHSPSKLLATTKAVKEQHPGRKLIACMELHTFSSLNTTFLETYKDTMRFADKAIVYFNQDTIKHKKLEMLTEEQVRKAFGEHGDLKVFTDNKQLVKELKTLELKDKILLLMSSGNFSGINFKSLADELISN
ncbi:MAG: peptidoglycan synthetase [Bacteroidales bacterium]|nr:peptidoglycan synthetase [Bacteroidales bacterium]